VSDGAKQNRHPVFRMAVGLRGEVQANKLSRTRFRHTLLALLLADWGVDGLQRVHRIIP
jgi:hypothetical protein